MWVGWSGDANTEAEAVESAILEVVGEFVRSGPTEAELQAAKDPKQRNFLSPEQQAEIEDFRRKQAEAQRQIRELRKSARADIDGTLASMKLWNILGTPVLVFAAGLAVFLFRRKSTSAK